MTSILTALANPGSVLFVLLLLALPLSWWRATRRLGMWLGGAVLAAVLTAGLLPVNDWLLQPLETYFPQPVLPDHIDGILVLGGAEEPEVMATRDWPELNGSADRLVAFVALAHRYPEARLVFSGGAAVPHPAGAVAEADVAARVFGLLGLDPARVTYERISRNTAENARNTIAIIRPQAGETWLLVTSARHMPRAVNCLESAGWPPVIPYPVDFRMRDESRGIRLLHRLAALDMASKEWFGLLGYRFMGHTHDLLPARRDAVLKP